jgi:hypothetical protein
MHVEPPLRERFDDIKCGAEATFVSYTFMARYVSELSLSDKRRILLLIRRFGGEEAIDPDTVILRKGITIGEYATFWLLKDMLQAANAPSKTKRIVRIDRQKKKNV